MRSVHTIGAEQERELILSVLEALEVAPDRADIQAKLLLEADLRGHPSHGLQRLPTIAARIEHGVTVPDASPTWEWRGQAGAIVDGHHGLGPVVATTAVELATQGARDAAASVVAVRNANHIGILSPYLETMARDGLIGIASTTSEPLVHPWGGVKPVLGTNPIGVALPAQPEPFVLDMATSAVSMGKVLAHRAAGRSLPQGLAVDSAGEPTTDPDGAIEGAISPFGGAKGYALGLALELLVGCLSDTALGEEVVGTLDTTELCNKGDLFIAIDTAKMGVGDTAARAGEFLNQLRSAPAAPGDRIRIPGERARAERERRAREGIEHSEMTWSEVVALQSRLAGA